MGGTLPGKLVHHAGMCGNPAVFNYGTFPREKCLAICALAVGISGRGWVGKFRELFGFHKGDWLRYPVPGSAHALCIFVVQVMAK